MLQPPLGWSDRTHIRVVFREPHLIINRTGPAAKRDESGQLQIFFRYHMKGTVFQELVWSRIFPARGIYVEFFEPGFVAAQKVLGIIDKNRILRQGGIENGGPAGPREVGETFTQTIGQVGKTVTDELRLVHNLHNSMIRPKCHSEATLVSPSNRFDERQNDFGRLLRFFHGHKVPVVLEAMKLGVGELLF